LQDHPHISQDLRYRPLWEDIQRRRAFALVSVGRAEQALPLLKDAISFTFEDQKDEQLTHLYLGTCQYELGQYDLAKEQFIQVIRYGLNNDLEAEGRYRLAAVHWRQGALAQAKLRLEEVVSAFDTTMEPKVSRREIYALLSKTCRHLGENSEADRYSKLAKLSRT
jgi:tetratricopeptide (TPR) repeat protein